MHPFVTGEPYLKEFDLLPEDEFLILACDGVWDEVSDDRAIQIARADKNPFTASCKVRDFAYLLGSDDNISAFVIHLKDSSLWV